MNVAPASTYEAVVDWGITGLTLGLRVLDNQGATTVARLATNITEQPAGSGIYVRTGNVAPSAQGQYSLLWDDGAVTPGHVATEDLNVTYSAPGDPAPAAPGAGGLCTPWITGTDVAVCGPDLGVGTDYAALDDAAYDASWLLYVATGRKYPGICERTVRPCRDRCGCWGIPRLGWAWGYDSVNGWAWCGDGRSCGCGSEEAVTLAGYPILEVLGVKIDGAVVDPSTYALTDRRHLLRLDDPGPPVVKRRWPGCQNITLPDTEEGTFSITYTWGGNPPPMGNLAAAQLARELWKVCAPGGTGECALPTNVTRVVRQGVTYETIRPLAAMLRTGSTGLQLVDAFVGATNPYGRRRRPALWSPEQRRFPRQVG